VELLLAREATIHSSKKILLIVQLKRKTRCKETLKSISSKKTQLNARLVERKAN
jgi:hypothetical protein